MIDIALENPAAIEAKHLRLTYDLRRRLTGGGLVIAFSGGVDSAFLLWAAEQERRASGGELLAITTSSASLSEVERADVEQFISDHGIRHEWHESNELLDPRYAVNDENRCFYCKTELFTICKTAAAKYGFQWIAYGYNASDRGDTRPGHRAALDNSILSPLAEAGLTKNDIRTLMKQNGLEMADKPASPCLSSRLMTGVAVTRQKLDDVEQIEAALRRGGMRVFRVRMHEESGTKFLRIEVAAEEMELALGLRDELVGEGLRRGYRWVTLDLAGYRTGGGNLPPQ
jgi:uncharacterized protein